MQTPHDTVLAFDFGGTKLVAAIINKSTGQILHYQQRQTPRNLGSQGSLDVIKSLGSDLLNLENELDIQAIGISFGGPISRDGQWIITSQHVEGWDTYPLPQILSQQFGLPVFMENDANAAALGEWYFGAGEKCESLFYFQASTGIGSGIVINGKIYRGKGMAGEFGHLTVEENGLQCACGKFGCLESYSAGWGIASRAKNLYPNLPAGSALRALTQDQPDQVTTELVFAAYRHGDPAMKELVRSSMGSLARALADVVCILDPDRVVIGGGMSKSKDIMQAEMMPYLDQFIPAFLQKHFDLRFSELDGKETLFGAALLTDGGYR
jgi:glucokinase